jgi:hypothetical protein
LQQKALPMAPGKEEPFEAALTAAYWSSPT